MLERAAARIAGGEPLDVRALARDTGVGRSTLYRWFGDRSALLGEALWHLTEHAWCRAGVRASGAGPEFVVSVFEHFLREIDESRVAATLLTSEPREAFVAVMSPSGSVQRRAVARTHQLLVQNTDLEGRGARDVAEVLTQVTMASVWGLVVAGGPADVDGAVAVCRRLIV